MHHPVEVLIVDFYLIFKWGKIKKCFFETRGLVFRVKYSSKCFGYNNEFEFVGALWPFCYHRNDINTFVGWVSMYVCYVLCTWLCIFGRSIFMVSRLPKNMQYVAAFISWVNGKFYISTSQQNSGNNTHLSENSISHQFYHSLMAKDWYFTRIHNAYNYN